jgi:hypothetical protein
VRRSIPVLALLVLGLLGPVPAEAAKRSVPRGFYGVMWNRAGTDAPAVTAEEQFALMARSGVESVRTVFSWADAQPVAGQPPRFTATDRVVALAAAHGIDLLPVVIYSPLWAAQYPGRSISQPARPADYAAYLAALVGRYGPRGTFWGEHPELPRRPLRHWQIWNEPHLDHYWEAGGEATAWAPGYARLLRASYRAIKRADRGAKVVAAGVADFIWDHLARLYRTGVRRSFDVVTINFFTSSPRNVIRGVRRARMVMKRHRDARKPIWITETTWPSSQGLLPEKKRPAWQLRWETTPAGTSRRLRGLYALAAKQRRRYRLGRVYWYTWATFYSRDDLFDYDGLLSFDGSSFTPMPSLGAYAASARRHQGCAKTSAGRCR